MRVNIYFTRLIFLMTLLIYSIPLTKTFPQGKDNFDSIIEKYSNQFGVDKNLVKSLIQVSSGGNSKAISPSGAMGLMQLTTPTIKSMGIKDPYDPEENIRGGCKYLKTLMDQFNNIEFTIAAFDAGPGEVKKYGKVPPIAETKKFVEAVMSRYKKLKDEKTNSEVFGSWVGTGRYTKYEMKPPVVKSVVGQTQPFDIEILPQGSGVCLKTSKGLLGNPDLYVTHLEGNKLRVEYSGPNLFAIPIPNTTSTNTMKYVFNVTIADGILKGEFQCNVYSKLIYNIPNMKLPEAETTIDYTMILNLKKK